MPGLPPWRRPCSFSSGLHEPYSGYYKNYVDYYGGMDYLDGKLLLNTTDLEVAPIRELAQEPKAVIEKVNYALNQLAMKIVELGNAGKINGYGGPLAVLPRHNRGGPDRLDGQIPGAGGLSPAALLEELGPPATCST